MYNAYDDERFQKVNNYYKVPDSVLDIVEKVSKDDSEYKKLAGTEEFLVYTRQLDGNIIIPEARGFDAYDYNSIVSMIKHKEIKRICEYCENKKCNYLALNKDIEIPIEYTLAYNIQKMHENDEYSLYKLDIVLDDND